MRLCFVLVVTVSLVILATGPAPAAEAAGKFALVIGNAKYPHSDLPLPEISNDSREIADELKRHNFEVEIGVNLTGEAMRAALDRLYRKIKPGSASLIFFGGFGIQSRDRLI